MYIPQSIYPGVSWVKKNKKWSARLCIMGKVFCCGLHIDDKLAYDAIIDRRLELMGVFRPPEDLPGEIWAVVVGTDGKYEVSNLGRVKSLCYYPKIIGVRGVGYPSVRIKINGKWRSRYVHRLVAGAFIPNPNNLNQVNHKNSIRNDNRVENLEWCTAKQNINHAIDKGRMLVGDKNGRCFSKLSIDDVRCVREMLLGGHTVTSLSAHFNVTKSCISAIKSRRTWAWVD